MFLRGDDKEFLFFYLSKFPGRFNTLIMCFARFFQYLTPRTNNTRLCFSLSRLSSKSVVTMGTIAGTVHVLSRFGSRVKVLIL